MRNPRSVALSPFSERRWKKERRARREVKVRPGEGVAVVAGGVDECSHGGKEENREKEMKKIERRR